MKKLLALLLTLVSFAHAQRRAPGRVPITITSETSKLEDVVKRLTGAVTKLGEAFMQQDLYINERIRSDGDSGIKQVRSKRFATRPYLTETHSGTGGPAAIHDHQNNIRTMGMGEVVAVLNGVEFRTRHNDYRLRMPSTSSREYHAIEDIPFPVVPRSVLSFRSVSEQAEEMRKYFEAFKKQDSSIRDYRPYFRPLLCYLEGAWTNSTGSIDESFPSDRHFLDANTWAEMENKIKFNSYSGAKDNNENHAYLPHTVWGLDDMFMPKIAQWNYRILCHRVSGDLPTNRLKVRDDLTSRMRSNGRTLADYETTRRARFQLNGKDRAWADNSDDDYTDQTGLIDDLMSGVPGQDNYGGSLRDKSYDRVTLNMNDAPLNAAYYHNAYKTAATGAMGQQTRKRGFSDTTVYMAMTEQPQVMPKTLVECPYGQTNQDQCDKWTQRWTYAIPLEIIYTTPLSNWNPLNIQYWGENSVSNQIITSSGMRNGETMETAYNGTNGRRYFRTPAEFYSGEAGEVDPADTGPGEVWVLDANGLPHRTRASGHHIFIPHIEGVGSIRQRYPIFPIHEEGSTIMKELEALKDIIFKKDEYSHMYYGTEPNPTTPEPGEFDTLMLLTPPASPVYEGHVHIVKLTTDNINALRAGRRIKVNTEQALGHTHTLGLQGLIKDDGKEAVLIIGCDRGGNVECWDGHKGYLMRDI